MAMHIITRKRLDEFAARHPTAASGLAHWYRALKKNHFASFPELRRARFRTRIKPAG